MREQLEQAYGFLFEKELLTEIEQVATKHQFKSNDYLIELGDEIKNMPLLLNGALKVMREDQNNDELLLYFLEKGDTCAMTLNCCMGKSKSKIRAVAEKDSSLVMIPVENMQKWFHNNASWRNFILQSYQIRFDEMLEAIDNLAFMKMDERLYKYLKNMAMVDESKTISIKHQDIAEDLNTSRVVVSRLLKKLENENKIELGRNKIVII